MGDVTANPGAVRLDYLITSNEPGQFFDNIDKWYERDAGETYGKYTLYTIPGEKGWKLIINKQTGQWGTEYDSKQDLIQADMAVSATAGPVENFTISFHEMGKGCHIYLDWENTRAATEISEK